VVVAVTENGGSSIRLRRALSSLFLDYHGVALENQGSLISAAPPMATRFTRHQTETESLQLALAEENGIGLKYSDNVPSGASLIVKKAVITAAAPSQRTLPLQTLIDGDSNEKSLLRILIEQSLAAGVQEIAVVICPGDETPYAQGARTSCFIDSIYSAV
jgi:hypothetical protein